MEADDDLPEQCEECRIPRGELDSEEERLHVMITGYCFDCVPPAAVQRLNEVFDEVMSVRH